MNMLFQVFAPIGKLDCNLKNLAFLLRHHELWPVGFEWNYRHRDTCAMGLAMRYWGWGHRASITSITDVFNIDIAAAVDLFGTLSYGEGGGMTENVTPEMVADRIMNKYARV